MSVRNDRPSSHFDQATDEDEITATQKQYVRDIEVKSGVMATDAELSYKRFASRYIRENEVKAGYNRRSTPGGYVRDGSA